MPPFGTIHPPMLGRETSSTSRAPSRTRYGIAAAWRAVRGVLLGVFAVHKSESVQHTLHAMGQAVLDRVPEVSAIRIVMPNKHHLPVDVSRLGFENRNEIFVATDEPHGLIEATLVR